MPLLSPEETEGMLQDAGGEPVTFEGQDTFGSTDYFDEGLLDVGVKGRDHSVVVATGILTGLKKGLPINVDGTNYEIRKFEAEDDGGITRIWLKEA